MRWDFPSSWLSFTSNADTPPIEAWTQADPLRGADVGWLSVAREFVRRCARPGQRIYDPFAGFGTVLLAARLEGCEALGTELAPARIAALRERFEEHGDAVTVLPGDAARVSPAPQSIDLCLTSVPYFRPRCAAQFGPGNLYDLDDLDVYLAALGDVFVRTHATLRNGGGAVFFVEDVVTETGTVPLAAHVMARVAEVFDYRGHVAVLYPTRAPARSAGVPRNHELAILGERRPAQVDLRTAWTWLHDLVQAEVPLVVFGSVARNLVAAGHHLDDASELPAADVDLLVPPEPHHVIKAAHVLADAGFELYSWQQRVVPEQVTPELLRGRRYLRAGRADLVIDLCYDLEGRPFSRLSTSATMVDGIAVASLHVGV